MIDLRNDTLRSIGSAVRIPRYDRSQLRPGIVHIGVGNFHRVHQATVIDSCLHVPGNEDWAISGVGLTNGPAASEKAAAYRVQDNLYTVTELNADMSMATRVIGAMVEYWHAPQNPRAVLERLADPNVRIPWMSCTIFRASLRAPLLDSSWLR
jgi:mannitol 2-dehydrogenase